MNFVDVIKKSVISEFSSSMSLGGTLISLGVAFIIGLFIVFIYRKTYTGVVYSKAFALCMILLAMVTALIIRTINSNLALSLGMVGALSIVRFRTAVKEPVDTAFMFWAIAAGIMAGAGIYLVAAVGSLALGVLFFVAYLMGFRVTSRYLFIVKYHRSVNDVVMKKIKMLPKNKLKSKSLYDNYVELTFEVDMKKGKKDLVDEYVGIEGIVNVSLISYQNDFGE